MTKDDRMQRIEVLTGEERRRVWTEEKKDEILAAAFAPGAGVTAVARRYNMTKATIYRWRIERSRPPKGLAPVVVTLSAPTDTHKARHCQHAHRHFRGLRRMQRRPPVHPASSVSARNPPGRVTPSDRSNTPAILLIKERSLTRHHCRALSTPASTRRKGRRFDIPGVRAARTT